MLRNYLIKIFEDTKSKSFWIFNHGVGAIIIASLVVVLLETDPDIHQKYGTYLVKLEYFFTGIFTLDYFARIYLSRKKAGYIFSFYGIIDLLSILPTYMALANFQFFQILRVARLLRLFRLIRFWTILRMAGVGAKSRETEWKFLRLNLAIYIFAYVVLTITFSIILFYIEHNVPGTQITSIQNSIWSIISALSSVGFGDTFPVSFPGRLFLGFVMFIGVGFLSFAILILGRMIQMFLFGGDIEREWRDLRDSRDGLVERQEKLLQEEGEKTID